MSIIEIQPVYVIERKRPESPGGVVAFLLVRAVSALGAARAVLESRPLAAGETLEVTPAGWAAGAEGGAA